MASYVALLRGFKDVETVIASGNVVFSSASKNTGALEARIERTKR